MIKGYVHKIESLGAVDGPGVRSVVFLKGCPLRCLYCHNPDTWDGKGQEYTPEELAKALLRYKPYIKRGGVTISGGEPLIQAKFVKKLFEALKNENIHTALDTSGCILDGDVKELLSLTDLIILDIKAVTEEGYKSLCGGSLNSTLNFLKYLADIGKDTWIRQVVVPNINDDENSVLALKALIAPYKDIIKKIELLPFRKLCLEKYEELNIPFPLKDVPEADEQKVKKLQELLAN